MGKGKGKKGGGKKGKGKHQAQPEEEGWDGGPGVTEHTSRIRSQYQLAHRLLKASADGEGSALVKSTKMADDAYLAQKNLKRLLSADNSHLLRRPGVGLSEAAGSLQAGAAALAAAADLDLRPLRDVLNKSSVQAALAVLNTTDTSVTERDAKTLAGAVEALREELLAVDDVEELAVKNTIFASRTYLLGVHLLPLLVCLTAPDWWADQIPASLSENKKFLAWKTGSNKNWSKALAALVVEKMETAAQYTTNDAASIFGRKSAPAQKGKSSSSESGKKTKKHRKKEDKKRRKKTTSGSSTSGKKKTKKEKTSKGRKKKQEKEEKTSSDSSASEEKKTTKLEGEDVKDKEKRADKADDKKRKKRRSRSPSRASKGEVQNTEVKIRCINAVDAAGNGVVKETSKEETLQSVVERFLQAQGKGEVVQNWNVKLLTEGVLRNVTASATPAHRCGDVALVRKGG